MMMSLNRKDITDSSLKKNNSGFQIPENYLEDFESRILQTIEHTHGASKPRIISFKSIILAAMPIAAMLVLSYFLFFNSSSSKKLDLLETELSWDEYASFEEDWITEELATLESDENELDVEINYLLDEGVTNNEIIDEYVELP